MKVQRTLPPAAALLKGRDLLHGAAGIVFPGHYQEKLEQGLREYFGTRRVFLVSSGKAALAVVLKALATLAPDRREVLIPAYTCWSVPSAVVKAGLSVAACDIDPATFDFDHSRLAASVTDNTLCVVSGNLFGIPSDIDRINKVAKAKGSFVVEDAAQAMGVTQAGRKIGTRGDAGFFSLGRGKNITCGSGGIIVTNNERIAKAVAREHALLPQPGKTKQVKELAKAALLTLFIRPWLYWLPAGLPFLKLGETFFYHDFPLEAGSGLQAGLLRRWKPRLETSNRKREENSAALAADLGLTGSPAAGTGCLRFPVLMPDRESRDRVAAVSRKAGLGLAAMYPAAISGVAELKETFAGRSFPAAESTAQRLITLPTHELTAAADRRRMVEVVRGASQRPSRRRG
jgi:dTDP-4-amino-4,6-dideoxygalactose transaminase